MENFWDEDNFRIIPIKPLARYSGILLDGFGIQKGAHLLMDYQKWE